MSYIIPESITEFKITTLSSGTPSSTMVINRDELERLENSENGILESAKSFELDAPVTSETEFTEAQDLYPQFNWEISPYLRLLLFSGGSEGRYFAYGGVQASASYEVTPQLKFSGKILQPLSVDKVADAPRSNSGLPRVRTFIDSYRVGGNPAIEQLYGRYAFKLKPDVYGRISAGLFESMFGGVSAEVLYKPVDQRWGVGLEVNYVKQREFDQLFSFRDYETLTGHASLYYDLPKGYEVRVHAGRYLAGDVGATVEFNRTFNNGWVVGAYASQTNVSAEDFGEGSFDKGLRLTIPVNWALGTQSKQKVTGSLASLTRDGGARLKVPERLYDEVTEYHIKNVSGTWGTFWK